MIAVTSLSKIFSLTLVCMGNSSLVNSLDNIRSVLGDITSESFKMRLSSGPVNGFIDINELYQMFLDAYDVLLPDGLVSRQHLNCSARDALYMVKNSLWSLVLLHDAGTDGSQLVASSEWDSTEQAALAALISLRGVSFAEERPRS